MKLLENDNPVEQVAPKRVRGPHRAGRRGRMMTPPPIEASRLQSFGRFLSRGLEQAEERTEADAHTRSVAFAHTVDNVPADEQPTIWADERAPSSPRFETELDLVPGDPAGEYRVEALIGRGSFGTVYRAVHPKTKRHVAVKVLRRFCSHDPQMVSRFIAEAQAVNLVRHPNVLEIYATGQLADGRLFHVMELLGGTSLDTYLARRGRLTVEDVVPILRGIAAALDAAHAAGIAHRDLKPANVFLSKNSDGEMVPKLIDFGIAKVTDEVHKTHETQDGALVGTPEYMAPEQCAGGDVDHRADIYAFGIMLYKLLTGQVPFRGRTAIEVLIKQVTARAIRPSAIHQDLPTSVDEVTNWMLEKDPKNRPSQLEPVIDALEGIVMERNTVPQPKLLHLALVQDLESVG